MPTRGGLRRRSLPHRAPRAERRARRCRTARRRTRGIRNRLRSRRMAVSSRRCLRSWWLRRGSKLMTRFRSYWGQPSTSRRAARLRTSGDVEAPARQGTAGRHRCAARVPMPKRFLPTKERRTEVRSQVPPCAQCGTCCRVAAEDASNPLWFLTASLPPKGPSRGARDCAYRDERLRACGAT